MTIAPNISSNSNLLIAELVTPEMSVFLDNAHMVVMPGSEGEFGVMPGHVSLLSTLEPGIVTIYNTEMQIINQFSISTGFTEITEKSVTIIVEQATHIE